MKIKLLSTLIAFCLTSCVSFVGNKIDLNTMPQANSVSDLDVYVYENKGWKEIEKYDSKKIKKDITNSSIKPGCVVEIEIGAYKNRTFNKYISKVYMNIAGLTFFILPYYESQEDYSYISIFNTSDRSLINRIELKENSYYINSLILPIILIPISPIFNYTTDSFIVTKNKVTNKIFDATFRKITNDVYNIPECK